MHEGSPTTSAPRFRLERFREHPEHLGDESHQAPPPEVGTDEQGPAHPPDGPEIVRASQALSAPSAVWRSSPWWSRSIRGPTPNSSTCSVARGFPQACRPVFVVTMHDMASVKVIRCRTQRHHVNWLRLVLCIPVVFWATAGSLNVGLRAQSQPEHVHADRPARALRSCQRCGDAGPRHLSLRICGCTESSRPTSTRLSSRCSCSSGGCSELRARDRTGSAIAKPAARTWRQPTARVLPDTQVRVGGTTQRPCAWATCAAFRPGDRRSRSAALSNASSTRRSTSSGGRQNRCLSSRRLVRASPAAPSMARSSILFRADQYRSRDTLLARIVQRW